jgi:hypothetical protein
MIRIIKEMNKFNKIKIKLIVDGNKHHLGRQSLLINKKKLIRLTVMKMMMMYKMRNNK